MPRYPSKASRKPSSANSVEVVLPLVIAAHALAGAVMLGGLIGRWIILGLAQRAETVASMRTLAAAAWRDPATLAARVYELTAVSMVFVLMVAKPF